MQIVFEVGSYPEFNRVFGSYSENCVEIEGVRFVCPRNGPSSVGIEHRNQPELTRWVCEVIVTGVTYDAVKGVLMSLARRLKAGVQQIRVDGTLYPVDMPHIIEQI